MQQVKVKRQELLERVRANRWKHIAEYKEACKDYKVDALKAVDMAVSKLRKKVEGLEDGELLKLAGVSFNLPYPQSHERSYNRAIQMLEMGVEDIVELSASQFAQLVQDDWDWQREFQVSRMSYSAKNSGLFAADVVEVD
jgi:hypothetical protein